MKVAIFTTGRFHVCDLARELHLLGHDVLFYSLVPPWRTGRFGLPARCNRWLLPWVAPWYLGARAAERSGFEVVVNDALLGALDLVASLRVERCDVAIAMSGMFEKTVRRCRADFGARILVERGSRHTLSQRSILQALSRDPASRPVPDSHVQRELTSYDLADSIVIPSLHVLESFREQGVAESRLFRNPYGVDLGLFPMTLPPTGKPTILMVGTWSRRKGCDVLSEAWGTLPDYRLLHVGPLGDAPLPVRGDWVHHEPVDQRALAGFYAQGHVFALASREEGLAVVLPQAVASGLSVVCTDRTGGADIADVIGDTGDLVSVVSSGDVLSFAQELRAQMTRQCALRGSRDRLGAVRARLSWREYGARYDHFLRQLVPRC